MAKPLYEFGMTNIDTMLRDEWNVEAAKSSLIHVIPEAGYIRKEKERLLDKTVFETFVSIFTSEMLKQYNDILKSADFTLYSPKTVRMEYGDSKIKSRYSAIYQFFCPGRGLNQITNSKERNFQVAEEDVRVEERIMYLSGLIDEIFQREGFIHGDPNLRHFFLLPKDGLVRDYNRDGKVTAASSRNGLGIIDVESAQLLEPFCDEVKSAAALYKERIFSRFNCPRSEEFFDLGKSKVANQLGKLRISEMAYETANAFFHSRFTDLIENVNLETRTVTYKPIGK
tara:strand:- start:54442 stop:55293 length:852 start_codon:yes stop_codon:yes gene_type:complete